MQILFFDVGYTLIDEDAVWEQRCREQAATEEAMQLGLSAEDIYREICMATAARKPQYRAVMEKYGFRERAPFRGELERLYESAPRVLEALSARYPLGIVANQAKGLRERLAEFGILRYFTRVISSADVGVKKPDARIFEYALELTGCAPQDAVMIGDRLDNDIIPAKALGMKTVWVKQGFGGLQVPFTEAEQPDYTVNSLSELPELL